jgi:NAD(P)-dependent dehydrogenase (short-subunit alcohol dehydrogenase family)
MAPWSPADIPDQSGRTIIITGANSGLGLESAKALAAHGASIVMTCRDQARGAQAAEQIRAAVPHAELQVAVLDLADLSSVRAFAERFSAAHATLDVLMNNAGVMAVPKRRTTVDGFELQFGTNHLGHFALTGLLLPALLRTPASRVVTVSSFVHERGRMAFDDLQSEHHYTPYGAYGQSKLANLLFELELDRRLRAVGAATISVGAHPGYSSTNLVANGPFGGARSLSAWIATAGTRLIAQPAARGAEPQLYAATAPGVQGGDYYGPKGKYRGHVAPSKMSERARSLPDAKRLWSVSQELTGVDIDAVLDGTAASGATS